MAERIIFDVNEWLKLTCRTRKLKRNETIYVAQMIRPAAIMSDGFSVLIDAGDFFSSEPRKNGKRKYKSVEVTFPLYPDELLPKEESENGCKWHFVPVERVNELIRKHGGIIFKEKE